MLYVNVGQGPTTQTSQPRECAISFIQIPQLLGQIAVQAGDLLALAFPSLSAARSGLDRI